MRVPMNPLKKYLKEEPIYLARREALRKNLMEGK